MPLSRDEIKKLVPIENCIEDGFGCASYDLHARWVIKTPKPKGINEWKNFLLNRFELGENGFVLEPQGMVRVVSTELIRMPPGVIGYALVKNALSNRCILAINIGIIDPGYTGPISSTLINFGKDRFLLKRDSAFLRLTFHHCQEISPTPQPPRYGYHDYIEKTAKEAKEFSSHTFLNLHETVAEAARVAFGRYKRWVIMAVSLVGLLFAALAIFAPLGASLVEKSISDEWRTDIEKRVSEKYESRAKAIEARIRELENSRK
ncbi:MAG: hypothetical protein KJZ79_18195 [Bryobacteraceae bacterium]|nr:hypothetical protein [Bryobacteraceae bacterium]